MNFKSAGAVESNVYTMLMAEFERAEDRNLINRLFNGSAPYTEEEIDNNHAATNVNDLSACVINHQARSQFDNAFLVPDPLFTIDLDFGPAYKRLEWGGIITKCINKVIKNSADFTDLQQSVFASVVLHGPGPSQWEDRERWLQYPLGVEDVLMPSNTLRSLRNLEQFAIYRQYTGAQLWKMTRGPNVDPAWNMPLVTKSLEWVDKEAQTLNGDNFPDVWFPEKMGERLKRDNGVYAGDVSPTVDCWDFYFYNDNGKESGWNRRIILDQWGQPGVGGAPITAQPEKNKNGKGKFLYDPGERIYASTLDEILHVQSGDASAVSPFMYHSQRSLGFLLYAVCHLQNRLYCKFTDSVFESLLQYFRVANPADMDRLTKIDLIDKGLLPEGLNFVRPEERWQINQGLVEQAFNMNRQKMNDMSASFSQDYDLKGGQEETATRTMAKVNSTAALVGAILNRAYIRERFRYIEICRRFCIVNSKDPDVRRARVEILKQGVPEKAMNSECWDIQPNKAIGHGNKTLAGAIADKMMAVYDRLEPTSQKKVLRDFIAVNTDNWALARNLVPDEPHISDSIHDSELAFGSLMQGVKVNPRPGLNPIEVAETIMRLMADKIQEIQAVDNVGTKQDLVGMDMCGKYAAAFIKQLAADKEQKATVKFLNDVLKRLGNELKGMAQRQQEAAQQAAQQNGNGQLDPVDKSKILANEAVAQSKMGLQAKTHAQKAAQKQLAFEQKMRMDQQKNALAVRKDMTEHAANLAKTAIETAHSVRMNRMKTFSEGDEE